MGRDTGGVHLEARKEVKNAFSDHSKAMAVLDYRAQVSLEEGLAQMAEWVWQIGARASSEFTDIEIRIGLSSAWR